MVKYGLTMSNHHFWWDSDDEPFLRSNEFYQPTIVTRYSYNYLQLTPQPLVVHHNFPWFSHGFLTFFPRFFHVFPRLHQFHQHLAQLRASRHAQRRQQRLQLGETQRGQGPGARALKALGLENGWDFIGFFKFLWNFHGNLIGFRWDFEVLMGFWGFLWDFDAI